MEKQRYRPGFLFAVVVVLVLMQWYAMNSVERSIDEKLQQVHDAINTNSVLTSALINELEKKNLLERQQVLDEARRISSDLKDMLEKMQKQKEYQETRQTSDNKSTASH